jgi:large subunit ribosomal protein L15
MADSDNTTPILSRLKPPVGAVKKKLRRGRGLGSGLGKTAGKGQKGQTARHNRGFGKLGFEGGQTPLYRRLPKVGFKNPFTKSVATVNVDMLEQFFDAGAVVDVASLRAKGLVKGQWDLVKVLGSGELTKKLTVRVDAISAGAKAKIEKAGGVVESLEAEAEA